MTIMATITFEELELLTSTGWRLWTLMDGEADIDTSGAVTAIRVRAKRKSDDRRRGWELMPIYPEDGDLYADIERAFLADYAEHIEDARRDWYADRSERIGCAQYHASI